MRKLFKDAVTGTPVYMYVLIIFSIGLFIGAFFCPPIGQIDPSIYKSVAILFGGCVALRLVDNIPYYIERGAKINAKLSHSGFNFSVEKNHEKKGLDVEFDGSDDEMDA